MPLRQSSGWSFAAYRLVEFRAPQKAQGAPAYRRKKEEETKMRVIKVSMLLLVVLAVVTLALSAAAQQISFSSFPSSTTTLTLNGHASYQTYNSNAVLRLTDGSTSSGGYLFESSTAFFNLKQPVSVGFTSYFAFQIHTPANIPPGDGFAFVIQNSNSTDPTVGASGAGLTAVGAGRSGLGYTGMNNALAIEFDAFADAWDPNANHVAVQSVQACTTGSYLTPVHNSGTYTIGSNTNQQSCLVPNAINSTVPHFSVTCSSGTGLCKNGTVHQVVVQYDPPGSPEQEGELTVWLDPTFVIGPGGIPTHTPTANSVPAIRVPYTIDGINLDNGNAWVGFTGSQSTHEMAQDILAWSFTPYQPTQVTGNIPQTGGQTSGTQQTFNFGDDNQKFQFSSGLCTNSAVNMTTKQIPIQQAQFFNSYLLGTNFQNEQCVLYDGTGASSCVLFYVTCQDAGGNNVACPLPCSGPPTPTDYTIATQFFTSSPDGASVADYLKSQDLVYPPVSGNPPPNDWESIFFAFDDDTTHTGKDSSVGSAAITAPLATIRRNLNKMFASPTQLGSYFVATYKVVPSPDYPAAACNVPNTNTWYPTDVSFSCSSNNAAPSNFTLSTSIPPGTQTANAMTGSQALTNGAGSLTVGPYTFKVDEQPPSIAITVPANNADYQIRRAITPKFTCSDTGGSGVVSCTGPAKVPTSSVGQFTYTVNSMDNVGNKSSSSVNYYVTYGGPCLLYNPGTPFPSNNVTLTFYLCTSSSSDISSPNITVTGVSLSSAGGTVPVSLTGTYDRSLNGGRGGYRITVPSNYVTPGGSYVLNYQAGSDPIQHGLPFVVQSSSE